MAELPSGTVTFLFTDIEGSTRLWEEHPDAMHDALARHDELVREAIEAHDGYVVKTTGDGFHAAFATANDGVAAAVAAQRTLVAEPWRETGSLRVRMGVHTGEAQHRDGDYYGTALNRAARLMSVGHGGQVLLSSATEGLVHDRLPDGCELVALGEHRLRDLGRAELLFQLVHPDLPSDFAALRTLDVFPGNLPVQVSSFIGRDDDLLRIAAAMDASPVVTLTGVGGVGKTRLALQVAADLLPRFADGAWFCELAAVRDPAGVTEAVAGVFGVTARPGMGLEESLVAYLGRQELLVVLDNCEHILRPVAGLVATVETGCPGVRVLATSREGLNVRGEQILVVPSLGVPDEGTDATVLAECEAVRLFVERARAVKANFVVDATNADGVAQVCRRLDGVPLAIELAAARITAMNPSELARRLDRRFRLLTGGERVAIERHQTLRATIDWSYDLLSQPEQLLLNRLSVFVGGYTLEAAEGVCAGESIDVDDVFDLLANLVARSLVVADDTGVGTRYRLLETIRQYGEERLAETGATDALRTRHCDYYSEFAGVVQAHSFGPQQIEWCARLARDHDNLFAAMAFALDTQDVERAMQLLHGIPPPAVQVNEVVAFDPEPVLALPGATDHPGSALALLLVAFQRNFRGDHRRALELCDQALAAERRLGGFPGAHLAMTRSILLAAVAGNAGRNDEAANHWFEAAARARDDGLPGPAATFLGSSAFALSWIEPASALERATEALALARQSGAPFAIADTLLILAQTVAADDTDRARALLDEALQLQSTRGYEQPGQLATVTMTAARVGEWPKVLRAASRALYHQVRSGILGRLFLAGILNMAARGFAEHRPETAGVLQGAAGALIQIAVPSPEVPLPAEVSSQAAGYGHFVTGLRRETTEILVAALGELRMRELRTQGAAMDEDQTCTYARRQIDDYLAMLPPEPS